MSVKTASNSESRFDVGLILLSVQEKLPSVERVRSIVLLISLVVAALMFGYIWRLPLYLEQTTIMVIFSFIAGFCLRPCQNRSGRK